MSNKNYSQCGHYNYYYYYKSSRAHAVKYSSRHSLYTNTNTLTLTHIVIQCEITFDSILCRFDMNWTLTKPMPVLKHF